MPVGFRNAVIFDMNGASPAYPAALTAKRVMSAAASRRRWNVLLVMLFSLFRRRDAASNRPRQRQPGYCSRSERCDWFGRLGRLVPIVGGEIIEVGSLIDPRRRRIGAGRDRSGGGRSGLRRSGLRRSGLRRRG